MIFIFLATSSVEIGVVEKPLLKSCFVFRARAGVWFGFARMMVTLWLIVGEKVIAPIFGCLCICHYALACSSPPDTIRAYYSVWCFYGCGIVSSC